MGWTNFFCQKSFTGKLLIQWNECVKKRSFYFLPKPRVFSNFFSLFLLNLELKYKTLKVKTCHWNSGIFFFRNPSFCNSSTTSTCLLLNLIALAEICAQWLLLLSAAAHPHAGLWPAAFLDSPKSNCLAVTGAFQGFPLLFGPEWDKECAGLSSVFQQCRFREVLSN